MKNFKSNIVLAFGLSVFASTAFAQDFCNTAAHSGESTVVTSNDINDIGSYNYELWADAGNNSATFYTDGSFSCEFSNVNDYLCREGIRYGMNSGLKYTDLGHLYADFKLTDPKFSTYSNVTYSYIGVYGWSQDPLIEWYIVDNWSPYRPNWIGKSTEGCDECGLRGSITVDGATYEVYVDKVQRGSIEGDNTPFTQYFSVRKSKRSCGTIDITAHFDGWKSLGLELGNSMYEAKVLGEAGQYPENGNASGTIDFAYAKVYTGEASTTALHAPKFAAISNQNLQVFDMQGKFLGTVSITQGASLNKAIKNKFHNAGVYMVKQGSAMKSVSVK